MSKAPKDQTEQEALDIGLEGTFPASDPPKTTRSSPRSQIAPDRQPEDEPDGSDTITKPEE